MYALAFGAWANGSENKKPKRLALTKCLVIMLWLPPSVGALCSILFWR
jgi:hypothetical protein